MLKIGQMPALFMRRNIGGNKVDGIELELVGCCPCNLQMAKVHRIKRSSEESYFHARLSALSLFESGAFANAPHTLRFAGFRRCRCLPARRFVLAISSCADLVHPFAQAIFQLRNAFARYC